jgi:hypothetical protein
MKINKVEKNYVITVDPKELGYILEGLGDFERLISQCDSPKNKRRLSLRSMIELINDIRGVKKINNGS